MKQITDEFIWHVLLMIKNAEQFKQKIEQRTNDGSLHGRQCEHAYYIIKRTQ